MARTLAALAAALLSSASAGSVTAQTWSHTYSGPAAETVLAVHEDGPGQLRAAAWTDSFGTATGDAWYLALSNDGPVVFESLQGEADPGGADAAAFARDGGAVFVGRKVVDFFLKQDAWVLRVDDAGVRQWGRLIAWVGLGRTALTAVVEPPSGGWFLAGTSGQNDFPPQNALLVRMDDSGAILWMREHGSGAADTPRSIAATSDGGLVLAGTTTAGGNEDALLVRYDFSGDIDWQWRYGGGAADEANDVIVLSSGGYAVAGTTQSFTASGRAPWLQRFDATGGLVWARVFGDQEWGDLQAVIETSDGQLVALGRISEPGYPTNDLWAVKVDSADGTVLWQRAYEGDSGDWGNDLHELFDGSLLLGGTWGWGFPEEALWLLRTDSEGRIPTCGFVRDTALVATDPRLSPAAGPLVDQIPRPATLPLSFTDETGGALATRQCVSAGCPPLVCDRIEALADSPCEPGRLTLELISSGGEAPLTVGWDLDGDGSADVTGNPVQVELPTGMPVVRAKVRDSCADPGPQECELSRPLVVDAPPDPPAEVSAVPAGEPPLLVLDEGRLLSFEEEATAQAYGIHVGALGAWYGPRPAGATSCHVEDALPVGDGTATWAADLPADSWVVVTAEDGCFEGSAGRDSLGSARASAPGWEACGPLP